jgi:XisI protein
VDKLAKYQVVVEQLIRRYAAADQPQARADQSQVEMETQLVIDTERGHYQWWNIGWRGFDRIYRCNVHLDIKDGKIWLQENWTEEDPAAALVLMGVPREDIVLGLQPPYKRPYTDYGVA